MTNASAPIRKKVRARIGIRRGSRFIPILLLLLTVFFFVNYALPSGVGQFAKVINLDKQVVRTLNLNGDNTDHIKVSTVAKFLDAKFKDADGATKFIDTLSQRVSGWSAWDVVQNVLRPLFKAYVELLAQDFVEIISSSFTTLWQLGLYSLIPGLAGLIYRRSFWSWYLATAAILLGINTSGVFGKLTTANVMPLSGSIFFFVVSQIVLLFIAFRLRRHVQSGAFTLPPRVHNWGLKIALILLGAACYFGWGPGYSSGKKQSQANAPTELQWAPKAFAQTTATPNSPDKPSTAAAPETAQSGSEPPEAASSGSSTHTPSQTPTTGKLQPPASPPAKSAADKDGAKRSWIWSFLGDGFIGWFYRIEFILIGLPLIYSLLRNSSNWSSRSNKNIVICLDGTSNTPDQLERGFAAHTNVYKLFKMLKGDRGEGLGTTGIFDASLCKRYQDKQISFYYAGVGNKYDSDPLLQIIGMATGLGASQIIERAYLDLIRVYQPGDRVYITGFSRGAAIARLLARTIDARGAPRALWTLKFAGKHRTLWSSADKSPVTIDVLGCWDTVGSFGVAKTIAGINFQQLNLFRDLTVPDNVDRAYHMVALDEQRVEFEPTLMDPDPIRPERIVEVWFAGDHANIGGGWATDKLSDVTLDFLLRHSSSGYQTPDTAEPGDEKWGMYLTAQRKGKADVASRALADASDIAAVDPDALGQVRHWFSNLYNYHPRTLPLHSVISDTVFQRMSQSMPVYAPQALFDLNDALDEKRDLIEEKVAKLDETQSLKAGERENIIEYKNRMQLRRFGEYRIELLEQRKGKFDLPPAQLDNAVLTGKTDVPEVAAPTADAQAPS